MLRRRVETVAHAGEVEVNLEGVLSLTNLPLLQPVEDAYVIPFFRADTVFVFIARGGDCSLETVTGTFLFIWGDIDCALWSTHANLPRKREYFPLTPLPHFTGRDASQQCFRTTWVQVSSFDMLWRRSYVDLWVTRVKWGTVWVSETLPICKISSKRNFEENEET